jgi:hypothetical protein
LVLEAGRFFIAPLRCATGLRQQGIILLPFYPALTPSARKRALGPCWANLATRLTALSVGAMGCNARAEVIELSRMVRGCKSFEWREVEAALRDGLRQQGIVRFIFRDGTTEVIPCYA